MVKLPNATFTIIPPLLFLLAKLVDLDDLVVEKSVMAPNVGVKGNKKAERVPVKAANATAADTAPSAAELQALMRRVRREVESNAEYVGPRFAEEARKIHYEESEARGIYGEASFEEAKSLAEEGIEFMPLPRLPEEQN